jgi:hypothetical protein
LEKKVEKIHEFGVFIAHLPIGLKQYFSFNNSDGPEYLILAGLLEFYPYLYNLKKQFL